MESALIDTNDGGSLPVEPGTKVVLALLPGTTTLAWNVPSAPVFTGLDVRTRMVVADPGATCGDAFSEGLRPTLGP